MAKKIFYSFHFDNDVFRVQQIRNIGAIDGNSPASPQKWEEVKGNGDIAVKKWIDDNMKYKSCLVVLIGEETASRKWVKYEIEKAWNEGKGVLGIYIHNIKCMKNGICNKGRNPFEDFKLENGGKLSNIVKCYNPTANNAYNEIKDNIADWIDQAVKDRK